MSGKGGGGSVVRSNVGVIGVGSHRFTLPNIMLCIPDPDGGDYCFDGQRLPIACPGQFLGQNPSQDNCANWIERAYEMVPPLSAPCEGLAVPLGSKDQFCSGEVADITYTTVDGMAGPDVCCTNLPPSLPPPPPSLPSSPPPSPPPPTPSRTTRTSARQDPHLAFARGGNADFRGRSGAYYAFFSAPGLALNVKTENATFTLLNGRLVVHGTFITEAHLVADVGGAKRKPATASFWGSLLNDFNTGYGFVNGSCGYFGSFSVHVAHTRHCEELSIEVRYSSAVFQVRGWAVTVRGSFAYDRISGPRHRLDTSISAQGNAPERDLPHGLIGQSFSSSEPRNGKQDVYPAAGRFATSAQAEGAIEGTAAMYEVESPFATRFAFSRFDDVGQWQGNEITTR